MTDNHTAGKATPPVSPPAPRCCATTVQQTCCKPADKADCCGATAPNRCRCR
jgi:hypothetical protein